MDRTKRIPKGQAQVRLDEVLSSRKRELAIENMVGCSSQVGMEKFIEREGDDY